jgi:hypothetical protein
VGLTHPSFLHEVVSEHFLLTRWILQYCAIYCDTFSQLILQDV